MVTSSKRTYAGVPHLLGLLQSVSLAQCLPRSLLKTPETHRQVWLSLFWVTAPFSGSWGTQDFCLCPPRVSVSPVLWKFCNQVPLVFKVKFPWGSWSLCRISRLVNLLWDLELLQQCENFFVIIVLQFVGCLLCSSIVELMVTSSKRMYATHHISQVCCSESLCRCGRSLLTCASTGDTQTRSGSVSCGGHCSFPWVLVCTRFCLHTLNVSSSYEVWY